MTDKQQKLETLRKHAAGMCDDQLRWLVTHQVPLHERHSDYDWTFPVFVAEYRKRGLEFGVATRQTTCKQTM
jgi:hypothetical protein